MSKYSVEIELTDCTLIYDLFENPFIEKWVRILQHDLEVSKVTINNNGDFYGSALYSAEDLSKKMQNCVDIVNAYIPGSIKNKVQVKMTHHELMLLHKDFEDLLPDPRYCPPAADSKVVSALTELNIFIHQYENLTMPPLTHVDISPRPVNRFQFSDSDYQYFSTEYNKGYMYLSYGVTGIPPMNAYLQRLTDRFVSQDNVTAGFSLYFDGIKQQAKKEEMAVWFKSTWNVDISDPKLALGFIPLGKLRDMDKIDSIIPKIISSRKVLNVRITQPPKLDDFSQWATPFDEKKAAAAINVAPAPVLKPAPPVVVNKEVKQVNPHWPTEQEFFYHLQLNPYVFLPVEFNHRACFNEAEALLKSFVDHRPYDQKSMDNQDGRWRSLAIYGLGGDSTKTQNHVEYGVSEPEYKLTEIASRCPETVRFLESITDLAKCQRVRFMLLEPGAEIQIHSDGPDQDVTWATNIALNMPEDCEFWTDVDPSGKHNLYSKRIPIKDGSVFLFNNAPYHYLKNNSKFNRIHIIIHGPLRLDPNKYLDFARAQNNVTNKKDLLNKLVFKKAFMGKKISDELLNDWVAAGIDSGFFPSTIATALIEDETLDDVTRVEASDLITQASLYPLKPERVNFKNIDKWLQEKKHTDARYAFLIGSGTYALTLESFYIEAARALGELERSGAPLMGQIIDRPVTYQDGQVLPFMHEQLLLVNLDAVNTTSLGVPYENSAIKFTNYEASIVNIHDNYTPLFLKPGNKVQERMGKSGWCSLWMSELIKNGKTILNVPMGLRSAKLFSYPKSPKDYQYNDIKKRITDKLEGGRSKVFIFNNEKLKIDLPVEFAPDALVTVAAGFKPFVLLKQIWGKRVPRKIIFVDNSTRSIAHVKEVVQASNYTELLEVLVQEAVRQFPNVDIPEAKRFVQKHLDEIITSEFDGDFKQLALQLERCRSAEFHEIDFIKNPNGLLRVFNPEVKTLFWHSNAWDSNALYYQMTEAASVENYNSLAGEMARKLNVQAWRSKHGETALIGSTMKHPMHVFTNGLDYSLRSEMMLLDRKEQTQSYEKSYEFEYLVKIYFFLTENRVSWSVRVSEMYVQTFNTTLDVIESIYTHYKDERLYNVRPFLVEQKSGYVRMTYYTADGMELNFRFKTDAWKNLMTRYEIMKKNSKGMSVASITI